MIILAEVFLKGKTLYDSRVLICLFMLADIGILSALVYYSYDYGVYLTPFYLLLIFLYSNRLPRYPTIIVASTMFGFILTVELSTYWQFHPMLKHVVFYALIIPSISYFVYLKRRNEAFRDPLTSLPNRTLFQNRFEELIKNANRTKKKVALLFLDLDGFKQVNDTLGHNFGDQLLKYVAIRLKSAVRDRDTIARLGGDEFAVILSDVSNLDVPVQVAENIIHKFDEPYHIDEKLIEVGVSIGITLYPDHAEHIDDLIRFSDMAMYTAKKQRTGFAVYSEQYNQTDLESLKILSALRIAVRDEKLDLAYQPILDLNTGKVERVEALLRWEHEEMGQVSPDRFIALAEDSNLINELTDWVIDTSLRHCAEWEARNCNLNVSVNVSARNLKNEKIMVQILSAIEKYRLRPDRVLLEVTETSLASRSDMTIRNLIGLNMMGVHLSIDDFGTGHASLMYIQQLPVHEIKIDELFVKNVLNNGRDRKIVQSIIHMAHDIDCRVVAEGVESHDIMLKLKEMGCDLIQGFWLAKPMPAEQVADWLVQYGT